MHVVVINRNQREFVAPMRQALAPIEPLFVFDRCEPAECCHCVVNRDGEGFLAGRMRDIGAHGVDDDILFLDGDKVPQGDIVADIETLKSRYDCICYGVSSKFESSEYRDFMLADDKDGVVPFQADRKAPVAFGCYTCGMWMCKDAVNAVRRLNSGRIFHPAFDGTWGDEDNFLADELDSLGFRIGFSTHVRLAGRFSDCHDKMDAFVGNFVKRLTLNRTLLGKNV